MRDRRWLSVRKSSRVAAPLIRAGFVRNLARHSRSGTRSRIGWQRRPNHNAGLAPAADENVSISRQNILSNRPAPIRARFVPAKVRASRSGTATTRAC
jgi:hypothetical protein